MPVIRTRVQAFCLRARGLVRVDERRGLVAVKANEDIDDAAISQVEVVIDRVELPVKRHRLVAVRAMGRLGALEEIWFSAQLVTRTDFSTGRVPAGPFELRQGCGLLAQRLRHELEGRNLDRHGGDGAGFDCLPAAWTIGPPCMPTKGFDAAITSSTSERGTTGTCRDVRL